METVIASLGQRSYPIIIDSDLYGSQALISQLREHQKVMVVTNDTVAPLYLERIVTTLNNHHIAVDTVILPDGEQYKSLEILNRIFTALLEKQHGRDTTLIALGGGVIGDITGFAAATYQRGVPFIQIPTTLLAQVDSSVGGKTAVNHPLGKNMIGAFYQPIEVIIDINSLHTLPQRELSAGLAEVIKYGVILDSAFFVWLEEHIDELMALDSAALTYCIRRCCELKAEVVTKDECEHDVRALLNLGHTYGHAIETEMGYGNWLHGEAVAAGTMMAAAAATELGMLSQRDMQRIQVLLQRAGLPVKGPHSMPAHAYLPHMLRDKKVLNGQIRLVLPTAIGSAMVKQDVDEQIIVKSIELCL